MIAFLVFFAIAFACFFFFMDADIITFCYDLYRCKLAALLTIDTTHCLTNKVVWIVGASSGMGEHLVYQCVKHCAAGVIVSARRKTQLERVIAKARKLSKLNHTATKFVIVPFDLLSFVQQPQSATDSDSDTGRERCEAFVAQSIMKGHMVDFLVLNSGVTSRALGLKTELSVMERLCSMNYFAIATFIQSFISVTKRQRERMSAQNQNKNDKNKKNKRVGIFVTSSIAGIVGSPGQAAYSASKHAINGFCESLKFELYDDNFHIGLLCPGPIELTPESNFGIGHSLDAKSGRKTETKKSSAMSVDRCSQLMFTAMVSYLHESWIATNPVLMFTYIRQYLPILMGPLIKVVGPMRMKAILKSLPKDV